MQQRLKGLGSEGPTPLNVHGMQPD